MRIFVCEFITGGGMHGNELSTSLAIEGDLMLSAALRDLLDAGYTDLVCTRDIRLEPVEYNIDVIPANENIWETWDRLINDSDAVWIIAPETNAVLLQLTQLVEKSNALLIGCSSDVIQLASSKQGCCNWLIGNGLASLPVYRNISNLPASTTGWVIKPDDGAGGEDVRYFSSREILGRNYDDINNSGLVIQEYVPGIAASISMVTDGNNTLVMGCNRQLFNFTENGHGKLHGFIVNDMDLPRETMIKVASDVGIKLGSVCSFIGVDIVLGKAGPVIIEINPRITTPYAGLRESLGINPLEIIMSVAKNGTLPHIDEISFKPVRINI